ncbi:MAG TPA: hypothetical protein ENH84_04220 [Phycisphaerae bacterium]|nr:hypothetical protein [Phycisphaerae bacterium]
MKKNKSLVTRCLFVFIIATMVQAAACYAGQTPAAKVTEDICISLDSVEKSIPEISKAAELIAERWIDGGTLCVDGTKEWATEIYYRAGGLAHLKFLPQYPDVEKYNQKSIVLAGYLPGGDKSDTKWAKRIRVALKKGMLVVLIAPGDPGALNTKTLSKSERENLVRLWPQGSTPDIEAASLATSWALVGEIVSACTRRGKMPTMLKSVLFEGARDRNGAIHGMPFHKKTSVSPIKPGVLGKAYIQSARRWVTDFTARNSGKIEQIASHISAQKKAGKAVVAVTTGHIWMDPPWLVSVKGVKELHKASSETISRELTGGGTLMIIGYRELFYGQRQTDVPEAVRKAGGWIVGFATHPEVPDDLADRSVLMSTGWPDSDAIVEIPGYDIHVLPITGLAQIAIYRMISESLPGK